MAPPSSTKVSISDNWPQMDLTLSTLRMPMKNTSRQVCVFFKLER